MQFSTAALIARGYRVRQQNYFDKVSSTALQAQEETELDLDTLPVLPESMLENWSEDEVSPSKRKPVKRRQKKKEMTEVDSEEEDIQRTPKKIVKNVVQLSSEEEEEEKTPEAKKRRTFRPQKDGKSGRISCVD